MKDLIELAISNIEICIGSRPLYNHMFLTTPGLMNGMLLLTGAKGSGKSSVARALCRYMAELPNLAHTMVMECKPLRGKIIFLGSQLTNALTTYTFLWPFSPDQFAQPRVWSGSLLLALYLLLSRWTVKILTRLHRCAGWSGSLLFAYVFTAAGPFYLKDMETSALHYFCQPECIESLHLFCFSM